MKQEVCNIEGIPAVIWGEQSHKVIVAIHGMMSHKLDTPIAIVAEVANTYGYQVLSFDLPEHGDRKGEDTLCKIEPCRKDVTCIMQYAKSKWDSINLFANSIGAYFSLQSCATEDIQHAYFLSPLVDMKRITENMMMWFQITVEELQDKQIIPTPIGQTLYWDDYCFVKEHPIDKWPMPTSILYGKLDTTCEEDTILSFAHRFSCDVDSVEDGPHYFQSFEHLQIFRDWLVKNISKN